jgi:hypothetical protein
LLHSVMMVLGLTTAREIGDVPVAIFEMFHPVSHNWWQPCKNLHRYDYEVDERSLQLNCFMLWGIQSQFAGKLVHYLQPFCCNGLLEVAVHMHWTCISHCKKQIGII